MSGRWPKRLSPFVFPGAGPILRYPPRTSFSRIISYGTAGSGPQWFKVWRKGGEILEFGNTDDSRFYDFEHDNDDVLIWSVNKLSDTAGNYETFAYFDRIPVTMLN